MAVPTDTSQKPAHKPRLPWHPFTAVMLVVASYFLSSLGAEGLLLLYGMLRGWSINELQVWTSTSTIAQFINFVLVYGLMVAMIYLFLRKQKTSVKSLGLVRPKFSDGAIALVAVPVYFVFYVALLAGLTAIFSGLDINQQQELGFDKFQEGVALALTFTSLVILPPLVEEFVMRGFLFTSLLSRLRFVWAAIITSLLFAAAHLQFGSDAPLLWTAAIDTFILSLVLCYLRYKTGSLWAGIFLHMLKNLIAFLVIFVFHKG
jgi:membrane protease YdiL (CAAX protease family)